MALNRRRFLQRGWKVLVGVLGLEAGWTTWEFLRPRIAAGFGAEIKAGAIESLREGEVTYRSDGRFYLVKIDGQVKALYQRCPHLGCRVPYCKSSGRFECPCHASVFNRKGEYIRGPAPRGMDSFPVRVDDGVVVVDTGTTLSGPSRGVRTYKDDPGPSCLKETGDGHGSDHGAGSG